MKSLEPPIHSRRRLFEWTRSFLRDYDIYPRDRLSQSFLVNPRLLDEIGYWMDRLGVRVDEAVYEIGAGLGVITYYLVTRGYRVYAIEIDHRLTSLLAVLFRGYIGVVVVNADALEIPFTSSTIVSNTPFHISSDLLLKIARSNNVYRSILVLQRDVVQRIIAKPGTRDYGRLSIILQEIFDIEPGGVYPPSSFYPRPRVSAQVVVLVRRKRYNMIHYRLEEITRVLFTERRKKALKVICRKLGLDREFVRRLGVDEETRVYQLPPSLFIELARLVYGGS